MITVNSSTKIYVLCPKGVVTGGAELLHQLVHVLKQSKKSAYIVYYDSVHQNICQGSVPDEYTKYDLVICNSIEDSASNVVVLFEAIFGKVADYKNSQIIFWWLSVDNFFSFSQRYLSLSVYFKWRRSELSNALKFKFRNLVKGNNYFKRNYSIQQLADLPVLNCFQSEYAHHFLLKHGFKELLPLSDFINEDYAQAKLQSLERRDDIILYNPKKGYKFTKLLVDSSPYLQWVPLENMKRSQVSELLQRSKLYVDFGFHPGKDRIPREAAISGCCIVTGKAGSARYFEDIPIPREYKLDQNKRNVPHIIDVIKNVLNNYDEHVINFDFYRRRIGNEKEVFLRQVDEIFNS